MRSAGLGLLLSALSVIAAGCSRPQAMASPPPEVLVTPVVQRDQRVAVVALYRALGGGCKEEAP